MKTKKILLIGIMAALFLIPAIAYAALTPKSDVPTATSIKAHGNQITLNYNNMDGQIQTQVIATTLET